MYKDKSKTSFCRVTYTKELWNKLGNPDIGSFLYYYDKRMGKRMYGYVEDIQYCRKGIKLGIRVPYRYVKDLPQLNKQSNNQLNK